MKLWQFFLIGGGVTLSIGAYLVLGNGSSEVMAPSGGAASSLFEKHVANNELSKDTNTDDLKNNLVALRKEVALLKVDLDALKANMHVNRQQITGSAAQNQAKTDVSTEISPEETLAKEDEFFRKQGESLEAGFRQQTSGSAWSAKTKQLLQDTLTGGKISPKDIIDIECRASMCRLELASDEKGNTPDISRLQGKIGAELPNMMVSQIKEPDGSTTNIFYLSREEFNLPDSGSFIQ